MSRNAAVLSIPWEQTFSEARFSPDSRFLVVGGAGKPVPGAGNSTLLIADLTEARVVARLHAQLLIGPLLERGSQWAIGPAGKVLVVSEMVGDTARAPRLCTRHRPANR